MHATAASSTSGKPPTFASFRIGRAPKQVPTKRARGAIASDARASGKLPRVRGAAGSRAPSTVDSSQSTVSRAGEAVHALRNCQPSTVNCRREPTRRRGGSSMRQADPAGFLEYVGSQAVEVLSRGNEATGGRLRALLHETALPAFQTLDHWAQFGLLPLGVALLILHEHYRATTAGGLFRISHALGRTVAIVALVLWYDRICGLITGVAGAGGGWMTGDDYLRHVAGSNDALGTAWGRMVADDSWSGVNWDNLPRFLALLLMWVIVMISALFAFVASRLLAMSQAVLMTIIAGVGKTCLVVSVVPGVGLGKSWARSLAQVAAWSTVAGILTGLVMGRSADIQGLVASGDLFPLLEAAAEFVIIGACTLAVPLITARIMAGGGHAAAGVAAVLATGHAGARRAAGGVTPRASGRRSSDGAGSPRGQAGGGGPDQSRRPHKAPIEVVEVPRRRQSTVQGRQSAGGEQRSILATAWTALGRGRPAEATKTSAGPAGRQGSSVRAEGQQATTSQDPVTRENPAIAQGAGKAPVDELAATPLWSPASPGNPQGQGGARQVEAADDRVTPKVGRSVQERGAGIEPGGGARAAGRAAHDRPAPVAGEIEASAKGAEVQRVVSGPTAPSLSAERGPPMVVSPPPGRVAPSLSLGAGEAPRVSPNVIRREVGPAVEPAPPLAARREVNRAADSEGDTEP